MVWASRATSSPDAGSATRRCSVLWLISSTSRRMRSTGRSARPTSTHASPPTSTTRTGMPDPQQAGRARSPTAARRRAARRRRPSPDRPASRPNCWVISTGPEPLSSRVSGSGRTSPAPAAARPDGGEDVARVIDDVDEDARRRLQPPPGGRTARSARRRPPASPASLVSARTWLSSRCSTADTSSTADTVRATPVSTVAMIVMRTRTVRRRANALRSIGQHPVADVAHRLDRVEPERAVDLAAEVAHVDLDDVRVAAGTRDPTPRPGSPASR